MPSSGSTTQRRPELPASSAPSSPRKPSSGPRGRDARADQLLRRLVGRGDEVGRRALGLDLDRRAARTPPAAGRPPRARRARRARAARRSRRRRRPVGGPVALALELGGDRQQHALAVAAARRAARSSGKPSPAKPGGHRGGGLAGVVEAPAGRGRQRPLELSVQNARAAVVVHDLRRAAREQRRHDEVEAVGEDPLTRSRSFGLLRARAGERGVGDQRRPSACSRACGARAAPGAASWPPRRATPRR